MLLIFLDGFPINGLCTFYGGITPNFKSIYGYP